MIQLAEPFRRSHALERQMGSILVVFGFPFLEFSSQIPVMFEMPSLVELLGVGLVASLDLPIHLRAARRYVFVGNAEIGKMPGELWPKRRAVIGLNLLNSEGKMIPDLSEEVDSGLGVVVVVDAQDSKSRRFVNRRELIKALTRSSHTGNKLHIELDRAAWNLQRCIRWFWAGTILFQ